MENRYRQMLIDEKTHSELRAAKKMLSSCLGTKPSYRDVIDEFVGRRMRFLRLPDDLRNYINRFVSDAALDKHVQGVLLFGSVAKNNFSKYSDTDLLIMSDLPGISSFKDVDGLIKGVEEYREPLVRRGLNLRISPLVLGANEIQHFRPIYIDFIEDGVVLFERNGALTDFLNSIRKSVRYERCIVNDSIVIKWSMKA